MFHYGDIERHLSDKMSLQNFEGKNLKYFTEYVHTFLVIILGTYCMFVTNSYHVSISLRTDLFRNFRQLKPFHLNYTDI